MWTVAADHGHFGGRDTRASGARGAQLRARGPRPGPRGAAHQPLHPGSLLEYTTSPAKMATSGRSALLSSTSTGSKSTLENCNPEEDDGQDLWWAIVIRYLRRSITSSGLWAMSVRCAGMRMV